MSNEKAKVTSRVQKLMNMGTSSNANEARAALARASEMMKQWGLTMDDIEFADNDIKHNVIDTGRKNRPELYRIIASLGRFTSVKVWVSPAHRGIKSSTYEINILGYEQDMQLFEYFWNTLNSTYVYAVKKFVASARGHGNSARKSFAAGYVSEIGCKLRDLATEQETQMVSKSGTELVPLKMGNIDDYFKEEFGLELRLQRSYSRITNSEGYTAGSNLGKNTSLSRPINGSSNEMKLLG